MELLANFLVVCVGLFNAALIFFGLSDLILLHLLFLLLRKLNLGIQFLLYNRELLTKSLELLNLLFKVWLLLSLLHKLLILLLLLILDLLEWSLSLIQFCLNLDHLLFLGLNKVLGLRQLLFELLGLLSLLSQILCQLILLSSKTLSKIANLLLQFLAHANLRFLCFFNISIHFCHPLLLIGSFSEDLLLTSLELLSQVLALSLFLLETSKCLLIHTIQFLLFLIHLFNISLESLSFLL
jgi:hypothetical protein